jgi:hypothetical protein
MDSAKEWAQYVVPLQNKRGAVLRTHSGEVRAGGYKDIKSKKGRSVPVKNQTGQAAVSLKEKLSEAVVKGWAGRAQAKNACTMPVPTKKTRWGL